jgi:transposase
MDGARYHKGRVDPIPQSSARKDILKQWLRQHDIAFDEGATKAELVDLLKANKGKVKFKCVDIAERYGHTLLYTPPYHCELQPIEGVWAVVKNRVGGRPHANMADMYKDILEAFTQAVDSKTVVGLWKRSFEKAQVYYEALDKEEIGTDMESDVESSDDDDNSDVEEGVI